jgi:biopolymer transport protein ExbD
VAFSFGAGDRGGRRRGLPTMAEINIIPLVDVVLVLLIIFMLTAHVMEFGLEVNVPKVKQVRDSAEELPVVSITKDANMQLNETPVMYHLLGEEVRKRFPTSKAVYVRADKETIWDPVAQVISVLGQAGFEVRVVTEPADVGN